MRYLGGKSRTAKFIATHINNIATLENITEYYEPFVGGGSVIQEININKKYGSDKNKYLIEFYKYITSDNFNGIPKLDKDTYNKIRKNKDDYPDWLVYVAGIIYSFRANWFQGYFDLQIGHGSLESYNEHLLNEAINFKSCNFKCCDYKDVKIKDNSIIYCDAPYIGTTGYFAIENLNKKQYKTCFNFDDYYNWLIELSKNNLVFISEYVMPHEKFKIIDSFNLKTSFENGIHNKKETDRIENLYVVRGGHLVDKYYPDDEDEEYDF